MLSSYRRTTLDGHPLHPDTQMVETAVQNSATVAA